MGPQATVLFYQMITDLTPAGRDQDHIDMVLLSHASMPDRTGAILSGEEEEVLRLLTEDAEMLERSGAKAIAVPCNTSHHFLPRVQERVGIPFISMIDAAAEEAERGLEALAAGGTASGRRVAILATDGTVQTQLYQKALTARGIEPYVPDEQIQKLVMHEIYDCVKAGKPCDRVALASIEEACRAADCSFAILACTELSVIRQEMNLGMFYIDAMSELAKACIKFIRG